MYAEPLQPASLAVSWEPRTCAGKYGSLGLERQHSGDGVARPAAAVCLEEVGNTEEHHHGCGLRVVTNCNGTCEGKGSGSYHGSKTRRQALIHHTAAHLRVQCATGRLAAYHVAMPCHVGLCTCNGDGHEDVDVHGPVTQSGQPLHRDPRQAHHHSAKRHPFEVVQPGMPCRSVHYARGSKTRAVGEMQQCQMRLDAACGRQLMSNQTL